MYIKIIRVILIIVSLIYIGLILIFLIRDIEYLLRYGYGVGGKKSVFGLPITGFSKTKVIGFIVLELGLIITTVWVNFKTNKYTFLAFGSFSIPLLFSFLYLELHNKFRNYEFDTTHWMIILSIGIILSILMFSKYFSSKINFFFKDYLILILLITV